MTESQLYNASLKEPKITEKSKKEEVKQLNQSNNIEPKKVNQSNNNDLNKSKKDEAKGGKKKSERRPKTTGN